MQKILITGGSGFIGSHFHQHLDNNRLINLDLVRPQFQGGAHYVQGDIRRKEDVAKALDGNGVETILSLAAKHHDFGIGHDEYFDTNEGGTEVICRTATEYGIKKIIFFSSVAVYGIRKEVSNESMDPRPDSPYGASKLAGEKILQNWAAEAPDRKVLIIRPTIVFGANNMANMYNLIRQIDSRLYFHLGSASNVKSVAYVENLVAATTFLMERMSPGVSVFNYADEPQLTTREIANTIGDALGKKIHLTIPKRLGILLGLPFDLLIRITGKNLPVSTARIEKLSSQTYHSAEKLFGSGFKPRFSSIEGLVKMVDWYRTQKTLNHR